MASSTKKQKKRGKYEKIYCNEAIEIWKRETTSKE